MSQLNLPALLVILDGYGISDACRANAISCANTPFLDGVFSHDPFTTLDASGLAVGLPEGQMGNSEVGHLNMGAGRVVYQELTRIDLAIEDGTLRTNQVLVDSVDAAVARGGAVHLMGLVSDGGVHSHIEHFKALFELAASRGATDVRLHAFLDGRDVPPSSGAGYLRDVETFLANTPLADGGRGHIATVMGRYWAMDRDNRWERIERAYRAIVWGEGLPADDAISAVELSYSTGATDEFVQPIVIDPSGVRDGDTVIFFNFRPDRARELTRAFVDRSLTQFQRGPVREVQFVTLTDYDPTLPVAVAFPKELPQHVLADVLAEQGLRQLHIAETEKYAHVTFFFNGGAEEPKAGEERILVPSPKVATYDLQPEMSAPLVADALVEAIENDRADVYIVNFANCDMVGHSGVLRAAIEAVEAVDAAVARVVSAVRGKGGFALITADHGNAECMVDSDGETPFTAHTLSPVPLALVGRENDGRPVGGLASGGRLADVAPTLLDLIGIDIPEQWTGRSLLA